MSNESTNEQDSGQLRDRLAQLNERKEAAFRRKQEIGALIADKIRQIGDYRKARNDLTRQVRELKKDRDVLNSQITAKIGEIKELRPEKPAAPKPALTDARGRPVRARDLQRQIKALEEKIETVPMDFETEQKVMKSIKTMRKQLEQLDDSAGLTGELSEKSQEIDDLKKEANALHAKVTKLAKESQDYHEKMIGLSADIENLKKQEEEAYQDFLKHKQEYMQLSGEMREAQVEEKQERQAQREQERMSRKAKEAEDQKTLKQRAKEAQDKMLRGEKLTTEDLLALQSLKE